MFHKKNIFSVHATDAVLPTGKTQRSGESARLLRDVVDDVSEKNVGHSKAVLKWIGKWTTL